MNASLFAHEQPLPSIVFFFPWYILLCHVPVGDSEDGVVDAEYEGNSEEASDNEYLFEEQDSPSGGLLYFCTPAN